MPRPRRGRKLPILTAALALTLTGASLPARGFEGTVVDGEGRAIKNARACYVVGNVELICSSTNEAGKFELPDSEVDSLRVVADDYLPRSLSAVATVAPIALELAPILVVRLIRSSDRKPIADGQVSVMYSSGQIRGPFPVNASGVRIRRVLPPGAARLVAVADGFKQAAPRPVTLEAGKHVEIEIELESD